MLKYKAQLTKVCETWTDKSVQKPAGRHALDFQQGQKIFLRLPQPQWPLRPT
jgi:hypothetical protein